MKRLLALLLGLALPLLAYPQQTCFNNGCYPNALTPLTGAEKMLSWQNNKTVNIPLSMLQTYALGSPPIQGIVIGSGVGYGAWGGAACTLPNSLLTITSLGASTCGNILGLANTWTNTQTFTFNPQQVFNNAAAPLNQKNTIQRDDSSGSMIFASATDAAPSTSVTNFLACTRSGAAWLGCTFGNATDNPTYAFAGTGSTSFGGGIAVTGITQLNNTVNFGTALGGTPYGIEGTASAATYNFTGTTGITAVGAETRWSNDAFGPVSILGHSRGATIGTQTAVSGGDQLGRFIYCGSDGTVCGTAVDLVAYAEATATSGSTPGQFCIQNSPSGSSTSVKTLCTHQDRGVTLGSFADQGADTINANGYFISGVSILQTPGPFRTVSGTTDTLLSTDCQGTVRYTSASATTVTVPSSTLAINCIVTLVADGAAMTVTGSGLTLQLSGSTTTGSRAVVNGGVATLNTVTATKAFIAGPGVS